MNDLTYLIKACLVNFAKHPPTNSCLGHPALSSEGKPGLIQ